MPTLFLAIDASRARDGAGRFVASSKKVEQGANRAANRVAFLDSRMDTLGRTSVAVRSQLASLAGGIGAIIAARSAISTIANFEETLLTLQGVAVSTNQTLEQQAAQFALLEESARRAGATTRFSAQEAADGLLFLARAGFDANEATEALPATLNLAVAGVLDLGEAADIASNVLNQFGLATEETARVTDVLVRTANGANTDVRQLAEALKLAGPVAASAGLSLEETARAVGVLGDAGIQASLAGTNLRGILLGLSAPTSKAQKALAQMGLTVEDVNPATVELTKILASLGEGLDGLDEGARLGALDAIFGRRNAAAAAILAQNVEKLGDSFNETGRSAAELAALQDSGLIGSFRSLISAIQEGFLVLGRDRGFGAALQDVVDTTTDVVRVLVGMEDAVDGNVDRARELAAGVRGVAAGFATFIALRPVIFVAELAVGMARAATSVRALGALLAANPIGLLVVGISAGVAALVRFKDEILSIGDSSFTAVDFAAAAFEVLSNRVGTVARGVQVLFRDTFDFLREGFDTAFGAIFSAVERFIQDFDNNWGALFDQSLDTVRDFSNTTVQFLVGLGGALISLVGNFENFVTAFNAFDPTRPFQSLQDVRKQVAFVGSEIAFEIQRDFREAFDTDFVGSLSGSVSDAFEVARGQIEQQAGVELPPLAEFFDPREIAEQIAARAQELREARDALAITAQGGGEGADPTTVPSFEADLSVLPPAFEDEFKRAEGAVEGLTQKIDEQGEAAQRVADQIATDFGQAFGDVVFGVQELDEAVEDFVRNAIRQLFDLLVTRVIVDQVASFLGGISTTSASGNVFGSGITGISTTNASGAIFTRPTSVTNSTGGQNLFAEAGRAEGVLPLTRTRNGDLGVSAEGLGAMGGGGVTVVQNITTRDVNEMRRSRRQLRRDAERDFRRN